MSNLMLKILFFSFIILNACVPPSEEEFFEVNIDYKDDGLRKILDLEIRQDLDSLLIFMSHPNPTYRLFAAKSFASFQSEKAIDSLMKLLNDPFIEVRTASAFALGQIKNVKAEEFLISAFTQQDSNDVNNEFNATILESIGKLGNEKYLAPLSTVTTYRITDTLLLEGQARGIYQYGLRKIFHPESQKLMLKFLVEDYPLSVQKVAANYFQRFPDLNLDDAKFQILKVMQNHSDPDIRMCLATAITRKGYLELLDPILSFYSKEKDYRVKCNLLKQIHVYPYINIIEKMLVELSNKNQNIALAAADYLIGNGISYDAPIYANFLKNDQEPLVQIKIHQAILKNSGNYSGSRNAAIIALKVFVEKSTYNEYIKSAAIEALSEDPRNYQYIMDNYKEESPAVLKTKSLGGLSDILKNEKFNNLLGGSSKKAKNDIALFLKMAIQGGSAGVIDIASSIISDETINLKEEYDSTTFLSVALNKLKLPDNLETYNSLNAAISKINGSIAPEPLKSDKIKDINWILFDQYSATPKVKITTSKGEIVLELYKNAAPLSVLNFIELTKSGFYNNKYFHRVITNFVAQAGCPQGDGYGSLDYTIRSELNNTHYDDEGYIGYASSGLHTESTQWFITHCPTPHLDGKYTIFGKVISGMEIVHAIEVGDKIIRLTVNN